jgi:hypothetical protein
MITTHDIRRIENLLPLLPDAHKNHFALVYKGRGAQSTNMENPRVLMFGDDAKTVFAFNGQEGQAGFYNFELREFNQQTKNFEYSSVQFHKDLSQPSFSQINPPQCLACHGANPLPIYDDYSSGWPGFYGDHSRKRSNAEQAGYQKFVTSLASHPRYKFLNTQFMAPVDDSNAPDFALIQPLNMFGKLQSRLVGIHIANELIQNPDFQTLKYNEMLVGSSWAKCDSSLVTRRYNRRIVDLIRKKYGRAPWFSEVEPWLKDQDVPLYTNFRMMAFDYHDAISRYVTPSKLPFVSEGFFDGEDTGIAHAHMALLQYEHGISSGLGGLVQPYPNRMENYYGDRYKGLPSSYLDQALMWVTYGSRNSEACQLLIQQADRELSPMYKN